MTGHADFPFPYREGILIGSAELVPTIPPHALGINQSIK
jgi:hypothetical protein